MRHRGHRAGAVDGDGNVDVHGCAVAAQIYWHHVRDEQLQVRAVIVLYTAIRWHIEILL